jgi:hypothetical protein
MSTKPVRFEADKIERLGKQGTAEDTLDTAFGKVLDLVEEIDKILIYNEEPKNEKLRALKRRWCKDAI